MSQLNVLLPNKYNKKEMDSRKNLSLHNNLLSQVSLPNKSLDSMYLFNKQVKPRGVVTNQYSSGRCWLFAGLNMMRHSFVQKHNLPSNFEFSQNYMFFWDKFERVNYFIHLYQTTKDKEELDSRLTQFLLKEPLGDGGQWQMFVNLVEKYGVVPKSVYPDTTHSKNSAGLNMVLTKKLREYCRNIRLNDFNLERALEETYELLVQFLGKPPNEFNWEYSDKDGRYRVVYDCHPLTFYQDKVPISLSDYVSITNDPRNSYNQNYGVEHLGNVVEGKEVKYMNLNMERVRDLVKKSIDGNEPVWFGSDVGQFLHSKSNIMDKHVFDMESYLGISFGLNKRERIDYGESLMTHAMVISGYNEDRYGKINRWDIENSWGSKGPNAGYYTMSDEWMKEYVYQIVVHKNHLNDAEKKLWDEPISKRFPPWDPMGALAKL